MTGVRAAAALVLVALAACVARSGAASEGRQAAPAPHRGATGIPLDYRGPGRDEPDPAVADVVLGWFGPGDPDHENFGTMWRGASLALDAENAGGGYCAPATPRTAAAPCRPFRLVPVWSASPWQAGIADLLRLVYDRHAWAVIGGVDGASTHLALQVALKARFPLVSPGSTDVSTDRANVPWLFSLAPSDDAIATVVADALAAHGQPVSGEAGCTIVAAADHDAHAALAAVRRDAGRRRASLGPVVEIDPATADPAAVAGHVMLARPRCVLVIAAARVSAAVTAALRRAGFAGTIAGTAAAGTAAFAHAAGGTADGVLAPDLCGPSPARDTFASAYARRWGTAPDAAAANAYDAVRVVAAAVRRAGLNRARIRDEIQALSPWTGAGGDIRWNAVGRNVRVTRIGQWTDGRLTP